MINRTYALSFIRLWLLLACALFAGQALATSTAVWKVSKQQHVLYLGGTIHLLSKADLPLPDTYQTAYQASQSISLEIDLDLIAQPSFQQSMMMQLSYPYGENLQQHLSEKTYQALSKHLASRGHSIDEVKRYRAGYVSVLLTIFELQRLSMAGDGVDQIIFNQAKKDHKPVSGLEDRFEHFQAIATMGEGFEDELIMHSLSEITDLNTILTAMKTQWRSGDIKSFQADTVDPMKQDFPKIYQSILVKRNQQWLPKIERLIQKPYTSFVLVGFAHLVGPDGLLQQLKNKGYQVEQMPITPPKQP